MRTQADIATIDTLIAEFRRLAAEDNGSRIDYHNDADFDDAGETPKNLQARLASWPSVKWREEFKTLAREAAKFLPPDPEIDKPGISVEDRPVVRWLHCVFTLAGELCDAPPPGWREPKGQTSATISRAAHASAYALVKAKLAAKPSATPPTTIGPAAAVARYAVTRKTLERSVKAGKLHDHRKPGHAANAALLLDETEVASRWPKR